MAFIDLYQELTGAVPKIPVNYCMTLVNRAYADVRRRNLWSFQLFEGNWVSPNLITVGTCTPTQGLTSVVFNAAASAAIIAASGIGPFPTPMIQRQFRIGTSTIYNIWAYDATGGVVTLTLDRPYTDASGAGQSYQLYQIYYEAPMKDFLTWISIRDTVNWIWLGTTKTRAWADKIDPQRATAYLPVNCIPYQQQQNPAVASYGTPMFELFSNGCLYPITYQLYGIRKGLPLVNDTDQLPPAIGEDCVMALARMYAYEWAEAQKTSNLSRYVGSDFKYLMGAAKAEFTDLWKAYRRQDRETVDNWYTVRRQPGWYASPDGYFNSIAGQATPGAPW